MHPELLVQDRHLTLRAEARSARLVRMVELARRCCDAVRPSRIAAAIAAARRTLAVR